MFSGKLSRHNHYYRGPESLKGFSPARLCKLTYNYQLPFATPKEIMYPGNKHQ